MIGIVAWWLAVRSWRTSPLIGYERVAIECATTRTEEVGARERGGDVPSFFLRAPLAVAVPIMGDSAYFFCGLAMLISVKD